MASIAVPLAISGISALAGLFGNRKKQIEQSSTSNESFNTSNTPTYDASTEIMKKLLMDRFLGRTEDDNDFFSGYTNSGLSNINRGFDSNSLNIENILASRGLGRTSAGVSSLVGNQINRGSQIASLLNSIPLLADERARTNLTDAAGFFNMIPTGTTSSGTSTRTTKGTEIQPGNQLGGTFASLGTTLAGLFGQGAFSNKPKINI